MTRGNMNNRMDERIRISTDPHITDARERVSPGEMERQHGAPDDASSEGLTVVVQDSGLDVDHPWIQRQTGDIEFHDFTGEGEGDDIGHGTMVTDLATRVASGADIIVNRVFGKRGQGGFQPFKESFEWMLANSERIDALVMSWGVPGTQVPQIDSYVNRLSSDGVVPFAAAGNSGGSSGSPATARAVSVGALDHTGQQMTNFSSWKRNSEEQDGFPGIPEVSAIGHSVIGARAADTSMGYVLDDDTVAGSGTSFANPFVVNCGLDLLRRKRNLTPTQMAIVLEHTASNIEGTYRDGHGRLNWQEAVFAVESMSDADGLGEDEVSGTVWKLNDNQYDWIQLDGDVLDDGEYVFDAEALKEAAEVRR